MRTPITRSWPFLIPGLPILMIIGVLVGGAATARPAGEPAGGRWIPETYASADQDPVFRRVWVGSEPDFYASAPSPDGRYLTDIDWITGDLAVLDLESGKLRRVTDKGSWNERIEWAESSTFSPDGRRIAYNYWSEPSDGYEIRAIDFDGRNERVVFPHRKGFNYAMVEDWSADGEWILATLWWSDSEAGSEEVNRAEIALVSSETGERRVLKTVPSEEAPEMAVFSPDDRFVAYDLPRKGDVENYDIHVLRLDDGQETTVLGGPTDDRLMGWSPDGAGLVFYSDREMTQGIWRLAIDGQRAVGEPTLVKTDVWGLYPIGFSRSTYFYGVEVERPQVHTASIDVAAGTVLTQPAPVADPADSRRTRSAVWSPDGRSLAYFEFEEGQRNMRTLVIRSHATGDRREIPVELQVVRAVQWAPDGGGLIVIGRAFGAQGQSYYRVDLRSGALDEFSWPVPPGAQVATVADDGTVYYRHGAEGEYWESSLRAVDPTTSAVRVVLEGKALGRPVLSPDQNKIAIGEYDRETGVFRLLTVPVSGGAPRELPVQGIPQGFVPSQGVFAWTPDGEYLLMAAWNETTNEAVLLRLPSTGGTATVLLRRAPGEQIGEPSLSPDGRRIAFISGQFRGEIWRIQNLPGTLPPVKATAR
jgi:Tol biopolymer transport system component